MRPESSRVAAVRRVGHGSPPRLDSSHPELRSLAVHPLRPPTSAAEPLLRRIEPQIALTVIAVHRSFASPSTTHLRPFPAQNEPPVRFPATSSCSPSVSPSDSGAIAAAAPPRRRGRAAASARTPPGLPVRRRSPLPGALGPPGLPGARAAHLRRRPAPTGPEHRRRRCPAPCAAASRAERAPPAPPRSASASRHLSGRAPSINPAALWVDLGRDDQPALGFVTGPGTENSREGGSARIFIADERTGAGARLN